MRTTLITPPATLPVTWDDVRHHLRQDELDPEVMDAEQAYCMNAAAAATRSAVSTTRLALTTARYECDVYPGEITRRPNAGFRSWCMGAPATLELDFPPLQSVETVQYGDQVLIEDTDYWILKTLDGKPTLPGTIAFRSGLFAGCGCCSTAAYYNLVAGAGTPLRVAYTAGYGDTPDDVPEDIRSWILLRVGAMYEYREESAEVRNIITMPWADSLLTAERWFTF